MGKSFRQRQRARKAKWGTLSEFKKITPTRSIIQKHLTAEELKNGVHVFMDFEPAMYDFPSGYNMMQFRDHLTATIRRVYKNPDLTVLGISGAGSYSAFRNVINEKELDAARKYDLVALQARTSVCVCGDTIISGTNYHHYERKSDRACDVISQQMQFYPTSIGLKPDDQCKVFVITGDRDLGTGMSLLKERGAQVFLAYTGKETLDPHSYLCRCASPGSVMKFREEMFP